MQEEQKQGSQRLETTEYSHLEQKVPVVLDQRVNEKERGFFPSTHRHHSGSGWTGQLSLQPGIGADTSRCHALLTAHANQDPPPPWRHGQDTHSEPDCEQMPHNLTKITLKTKWVVLFRSLKAMKN